MEWFSRKTSIAGTPNFQLDTRSSGSRRNLDYILIRRTLTPLTYSRGAGRQGGSNLAPADGVFVPRGTRRLSRPGYMDTLRESGGGP